MGVGGRLLIDRALVAVVVGDAGPANGVGGAPRLWSCDMSLGSSSESVAWLRARRMVCEGWELVLLLLVGWWL